MDKVILSKIKSELPAGALSEIADKAEVSYVTVLNFFKGTSSNPKVLRAVNAFYGEFKKNMTELNAMAQA